MQVSRATIGLVKATNEHTANPAQEQLAHSLGEVITRQVTREQEVCQGAAALAMASTRADIIPVELRHAVMIALLGENITQISAFGADPSVPNPPPAAQPPGV